MSYASLVPSAMKGPISVTTESSRSRGACLRCLALTSMSRRFLQRRYDIRGREENASRHRCEERRMLRLLEMTWGIFLQAGLNVITNGILWDSLLTDFLSASRARAWLKVEPARMLANGNCAVFVMYLYKPFKSSFKISENCHQPGAPASTDHQRLSNSCVMSAFRHGKHYWITGRGIFSRSQQS